MTSTLLPGITSLRDAWVVLRRRGPGEYPLFLTNLRQPNEPNSTVVWEERPYGIYWALASAQRACAWLYANKHVDPKNEALYVEPLLDHMKHERETGPSAAEQFEALVQGAPPMPESLQREPTTVEEAIRIMENDPRTPPLPEEFRFKNPIL